MNDTLGLQIILIMAGMAHLTAGIIGVQFLFPIYLIIMTSIAIMFIIVALVIFRISQRSSRKVMQD